MLPSLTPLPLDRFPTPFDDPAFLFELKHDGFRALAYLERGKMAALVSRTGYVYRAFAPLCAALAAELDGHDAILDGELVCLDGDGRSCFGPLLRRREQPVFYAFDLLWLDGADLRVRPLTERKARLRDLVPSPTPHLFVADHVVGEGRALFDAVCARDCEGIVAKLAAAPYRMLGRRSPWVKIKNPSYSQVVGRREQFDAFRR